MGTTRSGPALSARVCCLCVLVRAPAVFLRLLANSGVSCLPSSSDDSTRIFLPLQVNFKVGHPSLAASCLLADIRLSFFPMQPRNSETLRQRGSTYCTPPTPPFVESTRSLSCTADQGRPCQLFLLLHSRSILYYFPARRSKRNATRKTPALFSPAYPVLQRTPFVRWAFLLLKTYPRLIAAWG